MSVRINSLSNGLLDGYPAFIYIDFFKQKHWRELSLTEGLDYDAFDDVLTGVFDDVIDFEKTGFIKTSDELLNADRIKLFLFQIVNAKSEILKLRYVCSNESCKGEFTFDVNLMNLREIKLKKRLDKIYIDGEKKIYYKLPSKLEISLLNKMINEYKYEFMLDLKRLKEDSELVEDELRGRIKSLLERYYFVSLKDDVNEIRVVQDVEFDKFTNELIVFYPFLGGHDFKSLRDYLEFIMNYDSRIYKNIVKCIEDYNVGFDTKIKFKCSHCGKNYEEDLPLVSKFFFM